jgi:hypothetical protein
MSEIFRLDPVKEISALQAAYPEGAIQAPPPVAAELYRASQGHFRDSPQSVH